MCPRSPLPFAEASPRERSRSLTPKLAQRCLAVVPARAGSKGIPGKNVKDLAGRPLIAHTLEHAKLAGIENVLLSTEDRQIAEVARTLGYEVPFLRPAELAADDTPTLPVLRHVLDTLSAAGDARASCDWVILLQPTSPLRQPHWIVQCVELAIAHEADAAMTVLRVPSEHHPQWTYRALDGNRVELWSGEREPVSRRQDLRPAFHREGSVYVTRREVLEQQSLYGEKTVALEVPREQSVNLDTLDDWRAAERAFAGRASAEDRSSTSGAG